MLTDGIYNLLTTSAAITAIVGTPDMRRTASNSKDTSTGVFPVSAPEAPLAPYIVFSQISGADVSSFEGPNALNRARFEFSCYALTFESAKQLARAVKSVLLGYSGALSDGTAVSDIQLANEQDFFEDAPFQYRVAVDLMIWFADTAL